MFLGSSEHMTQIPDGMIDLVVTSPPYDGVRTYNGHASFDVDAVAREMYRVCHNGSVVCWVVQDQTIDGAKTDTSFEQVFRFKEAGFRRWETIIYHRHGRPGPWWATRLRVDHEYIHVFFKGDRLRSFTKPMVKSVSPGRSVYGATRLSDGTLKPAEFTERRVIAEYKCRGTVWECASGGNGDDARSEHPAPFPNALAADLIRTFSNEGDIVLDPFMGSGTTAVMADVLSRNWVGYEVNPEYHDLIRRRLSQMPMFPAI